MLQLTLHPIYAVADIISTLRSNSDSTTKKIAVFQLRFKLVVRTREGVRASLSRDSFVLTQSSPSQDEEDTEFLSEFLKQGGTLLLVAELSHPDTLPSYASILLSCLAKIMESDAFDWSLFPDDAIVHLSSINALSQNLNVQRPALDALAAISRSPRFDYVLITAFLQTAFDVAASTNAVGGAGSVAEFLVSLLRNQDFSVQKSALGFITARILAAHRVGKKAELLAQLDKFFINESVRVRVAGCHLHMASLMASANHDDACWSIEIRFVASVGCATPIPNGTPRQCRNRRTYCHHEPDSRAVAR